MPDSALPDSTAHDITHYDIQYTCIIFILHIIFVLYIK